MDPVCKVCGSGMVKVGHQYICPLCDNTEEAPESKRSKEAAGQPDLFGGAPGAVKPDKETDIW